MNKLLKKTMTIIWLCLISSTAFCQNYDFVKVTAGKGITYNGDSISLGITNIKRTCEILKIPDQSNSDVLTHVLWSGFDYKTGERTAGTRLLNNIKHKSLVFEFEYISEDSVGFAIYSLVSIEIKNHKSIKTYTDRGLMIGDINPNILNVYPITIRCDYISENKMYYCLNYHGIIFNLEPIDAENKILSEIKIINVNNCEDYIFEDDF
jgi:hypothetical protein